jgi:tRNA(Ile)-lysidine synthase TilS/MesJ
LKVCKSCILNDNIFSVRINEEGVCNYCLQRKTNNNRSEKENVAKENIDKENTINESMDKEYINKENIEKEPLDKEYIDKEVQLMEAFDKYKNRPYQVLLAYSGGKDSTFTLYKLREKFHVSVLAVTFDNGFLTEQCRQNIHEATANLGVDSITIKPSFSKLAKIFQLAASQEIFPKKSLERASSICTACIGIVKSTVYKEAILRKIPFVCFGWTPGQVQVKTPIMKLDYRMLLANQKQIMEPLVNRLGDEYRNYFIDTEWMEANREDVPYLAYPLLFSNYNEEEILDTIKGIGWKKPQDTDMNSTNCLLNSYANSIHIRDYGYNPYTLEIATLVREGFLSREEGLRKLALPGDETVINHVKNELDKYTS